MGVEFLETNNPDTQYVAFNRTPTSYSGPRFTHSSEEMDFYCCRMWFQFRISAGNIFEATGGNVGTVTDRGVGSFRVTPLYPVGFGTFAMAVMHTAVTSASGISHSYRDFADSVYSFNTSRWTGPTDPAYVYGFIVTNN